MTATVPPNAFTVDLEDWYQGLEIDCDEWSGFVPRIERGLRVLLELLDEAAVRATFFVLGYQAERTPGLVRDIAGRGHEIASHGYSHRFVYRLRPDQFRDELRRSRALLEDACGEAVRGFRAPFFSVTARSQWALEVLVEEGFAYDSSIMPVVNYRYGIAGARREPGWLSTPAGPIYEIPLSTLRLPHPSLSHGLNVPIGGGGYFRLYPYAVTRWFAHRLAREGLGLVFYVHPWEYDPDHPRIRLPRRVPQLTHYHNLPSMKDKTRRLLRDFRFVPMHEAYAAPLVARAEAR